ncbi:capsule assembly Wzi family protein [Algoriphagus halophytocola]|uniref:Capsule assembly Wzi family protein n=1 Tax=Algoriphagus halophytocola TaxID=2991499 RepID=A0ABY6MFM0_9BACT|nr:MULTISPECIES: capsule assembly Wzi family protein [unclassified Algoriphagus]UZD21745.1 capsule assembly Wzi family protein [Algoriphagus sp. TR-M5]WBL42957.1 capsule assembly Wzi family protein [Algoriphagus sp. TR-M9]
MFKTDTILKSIFGVCLLLALNSPILAQTVPLGMPVLDDYLRRAQLLGKVDSASSFMIRPLYPVEAFGMQDGFDLDSSVVDMDLSKVNTRFGKDNKGKFLLLPVTLKTQYNSTYAFGVNDGAFIPNRGIQAILSPGAYLEYGPLSVQFQPELLMAQNKDYKGFPIEHQATILFYYEYMNRIDMPERFGDDAYNQAYLGQSSIRLNYKEYSVGLSSENLWWGPGRRNSLLLGNNAPGFLHFTLNTRKPVQTKIGSFEGQYITGFPSSSGFLPPLSDYNIQENNVYIPKPEDNKRLLSGVVFTYQPKWVPGLFLGYGSTSQMYRDDVSTLGDIIPVFNGRKKAENIVDPIQEKRQQFSSGFFRWLSAAGNFEFYGEYGTRDNDRRLGDFLITPESGRAFTFGFSHLMELKKPGHYFQLSSEMTQTGQTIREDIRDLKTWYIHDHVVDGYTHNGQVLGAGNGPGSNVIFVEFAWVNKMNRIGFQMERIVYNNDFYYYRYEASKDWRNKYVDLVPSLIGDWRFGNVLLNARLQYVNTLNYKWYLENNPDQYFVPGYDRKNFVGQVGLAYMFQ